MDWKATSKTRKSVSSGVQIPRGRLKKNPAAPRFSTHFSVIGYPDETLFLVFDVLLIELGYLEYPAITNNVWLPVPSHGLN